MLVFEKRKERYKIYGILGFFLAAAFVSNPQKNFPIAEDYIQNYSAGKEALKMKEYEKAIDFFQKALKQNPNYPDALTGIGVANREMGLDYQKESSHYFTKALIIDPKHPEALSYKGEYFLAMGKINKAYDIYQALLKINLIEANDLKESLDFSLKNAQKVLNVYQPDGSSQGTTTPPK